MTLDIHDDDLLDVSIGERDRGVDRINGLDALAADDLARRATAPDVSANPVHENGVDAGQRTRGVGPAPLEIGIGASGASDGRGVDIWEHENRKARAERNGRAPRRIGPSERSRTGLDIRPESAPSRRQQQRQRERDRSQNR